MTLQPRSASAPESPERHPLSGGSQLALIVGGGNQVLSAVEMLLDGPRWAVEFVAMNDEPYATAVAMRPDLVVVNLGLDEPQGFSLLSMLRLDPRTAAIPVLSYVPDTNEEIDEADAGTSRAHARLVATVGSIN